MATAWLSCVVIVIAWLMSYDHAHSRAPPR